MLNIAVAVTMFSTPGIVKAQDDVNIAKSNIKL